MHIDPGSISSRLSGLLASPKLNNLNGGPPRGNTAVSSLRSGDDIFFSSRSKSLGQLGSLLGKLGAAVRNIGTTPDQLREARKDITGIEASIQSALERNGSPDDGFQTKWVSDAVNSYTISQLDLAPGEEQEVVVRVAQSARQGGLYLSLGGPQLDLGGTSQVTSSFTIEVGGIYTNGVSLTFASGQTMAQLAAAINTYTDRTNVEATVGSGNTGILLRTKGFGAAEFVSVRVTDDGSIGSAHDIGIYNMSNEDSDLVDPATHRDWNSTAAINGITATGQDVRGTINGVWGTGYGTRLYAATTHFAASIDLATGDLRSNEDANAQNLGRFVAMRFAGIERDQSNTGSGGEDSGWPIAR
jgi:flagellar hook-associated protein